MPENERFDDLLPTPKDSHYPLVVARAIVNMGAVLNKLTGTLGVVASAVPAEYGVEIYERLADVQTATEEMHVAIRALIGLEEKAKPDAD